MRFALVLALAACSKGKPDDCEVVKQKPADAPAELTKRYPNNPIKVLEVIEKCVAPSGDECERVAKIVAAIPTMMPQLSVPKGDTAKLCRESPPEFRRCLLPSYTLQHADECKQVMQNISIEKIAITPRAPSEADVPCGFVAIYIDEDGTWLASGRDPKERCFAPRTGKELDHAWLEAQLRKLNREHECGPSSAELASADTLRYQEVISTLDTAIKAGFMDTGLSSPDKLAVRLDTEKPLAKATDCPISVIKPDAKDIADTRPPSTLPPVKDRLASAPVLVVTRDKMTLNVNGKSTDVTADTFGAALPKTAQDGMMILQADESTPSSVINRVITTAKTAGYDNILFAVKNR